jgi:hypothetical protein
MQKVLAGSLLVVLVSLAGRFAVSGVILPPSKTMKLMWNYSQQSSNIVFNIYHSADLSVPRRSWPFLTNVTATSCVVPAPGDIHFYTVTASNVVTGVESPR